MAPVVIKAAALSHGIAAVGTLQIRVLRDGRQRFRGADLRQRCVTQVLLVQTQDFAVGLC